MIITVSAQGYRKVSKKINLQPRQKRTLNFELLEDILGLDEIVVSATRNRVERKTPL